MGDSDGGVTLKIDADTAAYITKLARLADSHEKVTKHTEGWGHAMDHVTKGLLEFTGPLALVEGASELIKKTIEAWKAGIEDAGNSAKTMVETLRGATAQSGENREAVAQQLMGISSPLSLSQRVDAYTNFRAAAPGSAETFSAKDIITQASVAHVAGLDPGKTSKMAGDLYGTFGDKSFDMAGLLYRKTGDRAEDVAGGMRDMGDAFGNDVMRQAQPYLLAAGESGHRGMKEMRKTLGGYSPAYGSVEQYLQNAQMMMPQNEQNIYRNILSKVPGATSDLEGMSGYLDKSAHEAAEDEKVQYSEGTKMIAARGEIKNYLKNGSTAEHMERFKELQKVASHENPLAYAIFGGLAASREANKTMRHQGDTSIDKHIDILGKIHGVLKTLGDKKTLNRNGNGEP